MFRKATLLSLALVVALPAFAQDQKRYVVKKVSDGAFVVSDSQRTDGKSQSSNIYTTEDGAQKEADKQNKDQVKRDKKLEKAGLK
jgi:hypothetical protein